jgi:hypothetical protein
VAWTAALHGPQLSRGEALAHERAAAFCTARGLTTIADNYLRLARDGYLRWGAIAKVRQLDQLSPRILVEQTTPRADGTLSAPVEQLDLVTVTRVSQAVSGEIVLEKLLFDSNEASNRCLHWCVAQSPTMESRCRPTLPPDCFRFTGTAFNCNKLS